MNKHWSARNVSEITERIELAKAREKAYEDYLEEHYLLMVARYVKLHKRNADIAGIAFKRFCRQCYYQKCYERHQPSEVSQAAIRKANNIPI